MSVSVAVFVLPVLLLVNFTDTVTDCPGFSVMFVGDVMLKKLAFDPVRLMLVMLATAEPVPPVWVIVNVIVLLLFAPMLPKSSEFVERDRVAGGVYVPVRLIFDGDTLDALLVTAKVAFFDPAVVGAKVTLIVVDCP